MTILTIMLLVHGSVCLSSVTDILWLNGIKLSEKANRVARLLPLPYHCLQRFGCSFQQMLPLA